MSHAPMDRKGFLKNFGVMAAALVAAPVTSTADSQSKVVVGDTSSVATCGVIIARPAPRTVARRELGA